MAKLSISVPDDLVDDVRGLATGNVSAFVTAAIRHEVDRRRLVGFLGELDDELGPPDEEEIAGFMSALTASSPAVAKPKAKVKAGGRRQRSAS